MTRSLVIELFGAPGTGKSTLMPEIVAATSKLGITLARDVRVGRLAKAVTLARFVATHPSYTARSLAAIRGTRQLTTRDFAWVTRLWFKRSTRQHAMRQSPGVHLVDAGLAQALWSVGFRSGDGIAQMMNAVGSEMPVGDLVVHVAATPSSIARRLEARPGAQSRLERENTSGDLEHAMELATTICHTLATRTELMTVTNERLEDIQVNARAIAERIGRLSG